MKYKVSQVDVWYDDSAYTNTFDKFYTINTIDMFWQVELGSEEDGYNIFRTISKIRNEPLIIISPFFAKTVVHKVNNKNVVTNYKLIPV